MNHLPTLPCSVCGDLVPVPIGFWNMITLRHGKKANVICCERKIELAKDEHWENFTGGRVYYQVTNKELKHREYSRAYRKRCRMKLNTVGKLIDKGEELCTNY
jgi:hypothetical protein